ncbi:AI-2E family transporter [Metasolibacillus meyeri]|uniref:AI-2E family transporter n=1 Tax=Metasolibacillus meyeri TaxID=1071052 RepID=A0AAW9NKL3_9BACL|nr:AI-2E family transporter [Metasolibacillus meyeri]MEC1177960.1 AI-2E family transporter [Metasolibacillus meyeri]
MTKKLWFQVGIGLLLSLLIVKYFMEIRTLFKPLVIILKTVFIPLLLGGVLYYVTEPIQRFVERRGVPRWGSLIIIVVLLVAGISGFLFLIGTPISKQVNNLVASAPYIGEKIQEATDYVTNKDHWPPQVEEFVNNLTDSIQDIAVTGSKMIVTLVSGAVSATFTLILVPFFFIFMLKDHEKFAPRIYSLFSGERRTWIQKTLVDIDSVLRSYVQGQVLISFLLATMMFIGYLILRLDYALLLAILAFFMNMIPFIGPWISLVPALIIALIQKPILVIGVLAVTLIAQQIESNLITPNVMGKSLDIHPLTVITIILAAGNIAGFIGILIAIPTYAVIKVVVKNIYEQRTKIKDAATKTL